MPMFTGIVAGTAPVVAIDAREKFQTHIVELPDWTDRLLGPAPGGAIQTAAA